MKNPQIFEGYEEFDFDDGRWTRAVFRRGSGPAVIIIHEIPGLHPLVVRFADRVAAAGMTVFLPSLFGEPGKRRLRAAMRSVRCSQHLHPAGIQRLGQRQVEPHRGVAAGAGAQGARRVRRQGRRRGRHVLHRRLCAGHDDRALGGGAGAVAALDARRQGQARPPSTSRPSEIACAKRGSRRRTCR